MRLLMNVLKRPKLLLTIAIASILALSLLLRLTNGKATTTITIGETNILSFDDSGNGNLLVAQRVALSQPATLNSISFYVRVASGRLQLGIYDEAGGQPVHLLASTPVFTPVVGWNTLPLSPLSLAPGYYWLAYLPESNSLGFQADPNSGSARWYSSSFGSMPTTFASSSNSGAFHWSFYATLTVSSSSIPTPTIAPTSTPIPVSGSAYSLRVSANGRYLVDQNNAPFLIVGDSPHGLIGRLSLADAGTYLASRHNAGVNAMWVEMFCSTYSNICPGYTTYDGIAPFAWTNNDPNTFDLAAPNEAYFARVDAVVNLAAQYGITLFLDPTETGGWLSIFQHNGATKAYNFGVYLGNRYKNSPNIVWQHGNDFQTWTNSSDDNLIQSVANGIRSADPNHLQTVELDYPTSASLNDPTWAPIIRLDAAYSYYSPYDQVLREYNRSSYLPVDFLEGVYEYQGYQGGYQGPHELRAQEYWTVLSGAAGAFYGNASLYAFPSGWQSSNWQSTPGIVQLGYFKSLFAGRAWYRLVPDQDHTVVTAGYGTYQSIDEQVVGNTSDYATTARTGDGSLVVAYLPTLRTLTVDMSRLSGPASAKWYDPTNGAYSTVAGSPFSNSGSRQFTPPGNNAGGDGDWVLVLESGSTPPDTPAPTATATLAPPATDTPAPTATDTLAPAPTYTPRPTPTSTDTPTSTRTSTSATPTDTPAPTGILIPTLSPSDTSTPTEIPISTPTEPPVSTQSSNPTPTEPPASTQPSNPTPTEPPAATSTATSAPPPSPYCIPGDNAYCADPIHHWKLNEGSGQTTMDSGTNPVNGTLVRNPTWVDGQYGSALSFNGVDQYVSIGNIHLNGLTAFTIEAWIKRNTINSFVTLGEQTSRSSLTLEASNDGFIYSAGSRNKGGYFPSDDTNWHQVVFVFDGTQTGNSNRLKGYLDGVEQTLTFSGNIPGSYTVPGKSFTLGALSGNSEYTDGLLDDVRIYDYPRTYDQILFDMNDNH